MKGPVNLAYLIKYPDKAERFVRFAAIQEHRAMQAALQLVPEEQIDAVMPPANAVAQVRQRYEDIKSEFQITVCKKCGNKGTQFTWDLDLPAMVHRLGGAYQRLYLVAYALANLQVHATLASIFGQQPTPEQEDSRKQEAQFALYNATIILLLVFRPQNELFLLGLDSEIDKSEQQAVEVFVKDR